MFFVALGLWRAFLFKWRGRGGILIKQPFEVLMVFRFSQDLSIKPEGTDEFTNIEAHMGGKSYKMPEVWWKGRNQEQRSTREVCWWEQMRRWPNMIQRADLMRGPLRLGVMMQTILSEHFCSKKFNLSFYLQYILSISYKATCVSSHPFWENHPRPVLSLVVSVPLFLSPHPKR